MGYFILGIIILILLIGVVLYNGLVGKKKQGKKCMESDRCTVKKTL